jgi:hypothetical protein
MPRRATERLTDKLVRALPVPDRGAIIIYDADVAGFGARITANGARAFVLNYRCAGRERRMTIGRFPDLVGNSSPEEARELRRKVDSGIDPMVEREAQDAAALAERSAPTIDDLFSRYQAEHLHRKSPRAAADDRSMWQKIVLPRLGTMKVAAVKPDDIDCGRCAPGTPTGWYGCGCPVRRQARTAASRTGRRATPATGRPPGMPARLRETPRRSDRAGRWRGGPGNPHPNKPRGEAVRLEAAPFEHAIVGVDIGNQLILDIRPMPLQTPERHAIDGHAASFHARRRDHIAASEKRARQIDVGQHRRQQPRQCRHIAFAIIQDCRPFRIRPRRAAQHQGAHRVFLDGADPVQAVKGERTEQAGAVPVGTPFVRLRNSVNRSNTRSGTGQPSARWQEISALA